MTAAISEPRAIVRVRAHCARRLNQSIATIQYINARLIRRLKKTYPNGALVEMVLWQLPEPTKDRPHGLKYRCLCGHMGRCIVRYDNESGKGDHVHYGNEEHPYVFVSPERLVGDFLADVARLAEVEDEET